MRTKKKTIYDDFPKTLKKPLPKETWLAYFPYEEKGNWEKLRPVYVLEINNEEYICQKITSNSKHGKRFKKTNSYITEEKAKITIDKFYRKIKVR